MKKKEYIEQVLRLLNEAGVLEREGFAFVGGDNSDVIKHVEGVYVYAWLKCLRIVPRTWLYVKDFRSLPESFAEGYGCVELPDDFYELYSFRMRGWCCNVYVAEEEGSEVDLRQENVYARGTVNRPVCVVRKELRGGVMRNVLYYYGLPRGMNHEVERALYVPMCQSLEGQVDEVELEGDLRMMPCLCWLGAAMVARIFQNENAAMLLEKEGVGVVYGLLDKEKKG